jgi:hypothetical protein
MNDSYQKPMKSILPLLVLSLMSPYGDDVMCGPRYKMPQEKPMRKCLRKSCNNLTNHNGGFCSEECCKLDREERKRR